MITPDEIRAQIVNAMTELTRAPKAHYEAELKKEQAQLDLQAAYDRVFLAAPGNIEERKALAREATKEQSWAASIADAEFNRIKLKTRQLETSIMASQSLLRSIQSEGA